MLIYIIKIELIQEVVVTGPSSNDAINSNTILFRDALPLCSGKRCAIPIPISGISFYINETSNNYCSPLCITPE